MKRQVSALILALILATGLVRADGSHWVTSGVILNPALNTILCDTGPMLAAPDGGATTTTIRFAVTATVQLFVALEHRNAANDGLVATVAAPTGETMAYAVPASTTSDVRMITLVINNNDRIRVKVLATIAGAAQCSIWSDQ